MIGSATDRKALRKALEGIDVVVHAAGLAHKIRASEATSLEAFRRGNVETAIVAFEEAQSSGVRTFIYISSVAAAGPTGGRMLTDDSPGRPDTPYGISKLEAEASLRSLAAESKVKLVILRPPMVFGPGMRGNPLRLMRAVRSGIPLPLRGWTGERSVIYVTNLAEAIELALRHSQLDALPYFVHDVDVSPERLALLMGNAIGRQARIVQFPVAMLHMLGKIGDLLGGLKFPISSYEVTRLIESVRIDDSRFRNATGFRPSVSIADGMLETALWLANSDGSISERGRIWNSSAR